MGGVGAKVVIKLARADVHKSHKNKRRLQN